MLIRSSQKLVGRELEILIEQHFTVLHIINVSTDLIHAVGRVDGHYIVHTGFTKARNTKSIASSLPFPKRWNRDSPFNSRQFCL